MNDAKKPLFSVLIPTMNRPELVRDAIDSVLLQDCPSANYELVISNNGGCSKTKKIVDLLKTTHSMRYIEPKHTLNMPDHWEWASCQLHGRYVIILPDRRMLRQGTISLLTDLISGSGERNVEVVTWPDAWLYRSGILVPNGNGEGFVTYQSDTVIKKLTQEYIDNTLLPLGLNSCVKREVLSRVRAKRGRAYSPITPDYSSAFSILCVVENIIRSSAYLTITQGFQVSTGGQAVSGNTRYYDSLKKEDRALSYVPLTDFLVCGIIYEDFFRAMRAFNRNIEWNDLNPVVLYTRCWQEILLRQVNQPFSRRVKTQINSFHAALDRERPDRKLAVQVEMKRIFILPFYARQLLIKIVGQKAASKARTVYHKLRGGRCYSSGLEAAGFENLAEKS